MNPELLFYTNDLSAVFQKQEQSAIKALDAFDADRLLNTIADDLTAYFFEEYKILSIIIHPDQVSIDQCEVKIDVSKDPMRRIFDRSEPFYLNGTRITFYIPFEGDRNLFFCRASTFSLNPPRAIITSSEVQFLYEVLDHNAEQVRDTFNFDLQRLGQNLGWIEHDVTQFNDQLLPRIRDRVEERRKKILNDRGLVGSIGFPLRQRVDNAKTLPPLVRKKIHPLPLATTKPFEPEPSLDTAEYEQILSIISNMVLVMERSPSAFRTMKEEDLRQHFLVQLNGQYEGQATGETFNYQGKTDILIRVRNKNIFIAECKFWKGEKAFLETINQLLGYTQWRDTKTAILVFNRNRRFSEVVNAIPEITKKHPNYRRQLPNGRETQSRYIFHQVDDPNRELTLTIMAFDVPGND